MRNRLEKQLGQKHIAKKIHIGTFHSICNELLKASGENYTLAEESMVLEIVRDVAEELGMKENIKTLRQKISQRKIAMTEGKQEVSQESKKAVDEKSPTARKEPQRSNLDLALKRYQDRLNLLSVLDFDDLLIQAWEITETMGPLETM